MRVTLPFIAIHIIFESLYFIGLPTIVVVALLIGLLAVNSLVRAYIQQSPLDLMVFAESSYARMFTFLIDRSANLTVLQSPAPTRRWPSSSPTYIVGGHETIAQRRRRPTQPPTPTLSSCAPSSRKPLRMRTNNRRLAAAAAAAATLSKRYKRRRGRRLPHAAS